jgi:hypothetical protein
MLVDTINKLIHQGLVLHPSFVPEMWAVVAVLVAFVGTVISNLDSLVTFWFAKV